MWEGFSISFTVKCFDCHHQSDLTSHNLLQQRQSLNLQPPVSKGPCLEVETAQPHLRPQQPTLCSTMTGKCGCRPFPTTCPLCNMSVGCFSWTIPPGDPLWPSAISSRCSKTLLGFWQTQQMFMLGSFILQPPAMLSQWTPWSLIFFPCVWSATSPFKQRLEREKFPPTFFKKTQHLE